ncbi:MULTISPECIES: ribosome hibernation-promoting factor, HPF/YfiA family [Qipengyuania]|uniref:Ribosome hibernation promoting factor n=1 Tax=Qipengyuania nanhaisediminis TaxID=604088 RepID=A0A1I5KUI2_9SPHN|nr:MULTISPECIES: ribosome-associated translation inhibitor RaiA [Qipengyuania]MCA0903446.1 ribosome-associated translation inhibitor RaiA [Qipengyuania aquimaris]SFO88789.1 SSU ribosomal protein S30P/sigma 54 modulation protein [Qipengyuania nanhaisediminis]
MDIRVSGHQIDTGAALQTHVEDRMQGIVDKYFNRAISSHVTFGKAAGGAFSSDIVTHVMQGLILKGHAEAHDIHQAFDKAATKIEKQLRRYKRRIQDRHEQAQYAMREEEAAYTIFAAPEPENDDEITADSPPIVAETSAMIPECSVADAVMMLDLQNTNALLFKNGATEAHNMVYRRPDGSIGWVEPR